MNTSVTKIPYAQTGYFSRIILDYKASADGLKPFYQHPVSIQGIKAAIEERKAFEGNRALLTEELGKMYKSDSITDRQSENIEKLRQTNSFTITTAHQPNIFTGHLYFVYKILHTIKLCEILKEELPENEFVPVFYMGSEDADLDELGHVYVNGKKHVWQTDQKGAVGRMKVDKAFLQIIKDIEAELLVQPHGRQIMELVKASYTEGSLIEMATFKLVNRLFGEYGLIVLLPDNADLKRAFIPVMENELNQNFSYPLVRETVATFPEAYKVQAGGRELNLFYLKEDLRERIEKKGDIFEVVNTQKIFTSGEMMLELQTHPERFSPNVILRPVYQETILPNIVFIGGGGEVAYWLELKKVFEACAVPFPVLVLRNSFLIIEKEAVTLMNKLDFTVPDLFKNESELLNELVKRESRIVLDLQNEKKEILAFYGKLKTIAGKADVTLEKHTEALGKKALNKLNALEKKIFRAEKKKLQAEHRQLVKLRDLLFPQDSLQERVENMMPFYARMGTLLIEELYKNSPGLEQEFTILEMQPPS